MTLIENVEPVDSKTIMSPGSSKTGSVTDYLNR